MENYIGDAEGSWKDMEQVFEEEKKQLSKNNSISISSFPKQIKHFLKLQQMKNQPENKGISDDKKRKCYEDSIQLFFRVFVDSKATFDEEKHAKSICSKFPLFGISAAFKKFQTHEPLLKYEEQAIINFANRFTTCTLNQDTIARMTEDPDLRAKAAQVVAIVKAVNIHNHTRSCRKYDTTCRFGFGKFPSWKTLISKPSTLPMPEKETKMAEHAKILKAVKGVLDDDDALTKILSQYPNKENEKRDEYEENRQKRIKEVLTLAGLRTEADFDLYIEALETSNSGYSIIMQRDIDELFVNSYNPEWARAWNGNHDLQICLDYFAVITYITEYYTKDDSEVSKLLVDAMKEMDCDTLKEKMIILMNTYISARQMGESEAFFKIFPDFLLKNSNVTTVFVPVSRKENRSKFLMKIDEKLSYNGQEKLKVEGRDGFYVEKYDIVSKYERLVKKEKDEISFSHFAKMFSPSWKKKKSEEEDVEDINQEEDADNNQEDDENIDKEDGEMNQEEDREKKKADSIDKSEGPTEETKFDYVMSCKR